MISNEMLIFWMTLAISVLITLDIIEKVNDYRIKKIEKKQETFDVKKFTPFVNQEVVGGPIVPIKVKFRIDQPGMTPDEIEARLVDLISQEILADKDLINIRVYEDYEMRMQVVEGTLKVFRPKKED